MQHIRVSEILAQFRDFSKIHPKVLSEKCAIGTEVHGNIHQYKTGGFTMFDTYPVRNPMTSEILRWEDRGEGYFKSYLEWDKKVNPSFGIMEKRFYDDNLMLTGQIDGLICDEKPVLVDFKCSYKSDLEIWSMQAHYYKHLLEHNGIPVSNKFLWLRLKKDGKMPEVLEIEFDEKIMDRCIDEAILFYEKKKEGISFT